MPKGKGKGWRGGGGGGVVGTFEQLFGPTGRGIHITPFYICNLDNYRVGQ